MVLDADTGEVVNCSNIHPVPIPIQPSVCFVIMPLSNSGVLDPNRCISEFTHDGNATLIFYERFFNWEIASGNYLVHNTPRAIQFLREWADYETQATAIWSSLDNGALQIHFLQVPHVVLKTVGFVNTS
jgi:hypothetical protein